MPDSREPTVLALLEKSPSASADAAIVRALPDMDPVAQPRALDILVRRGNAEAQSWLLGQFPRLASHLQESLAARVRELSAGARHALLSGEESVRLGAIDAISHGACFPLAPLMAEALRSRCEKTRSAAANVLHELTRLHLNQVSRLSATAKSAKQSGPDPARGRILAVHARHLIYALTAALARWELHYNAKIMEAAFWMGEPLEPFLRRKLEDPRSQLAPLLQGIVEQTSDPRLAPFVWCALGMPGLRDAATAAIRRAQNTAFRRALVASAWLLGDIGVERGCRYVRSCTWLAEDLIEATDSPEFARRAVHLALSLHQDGTARNRLLRELLNHEDVRWVRSAVWALLGDRGAESTHLLALAEGRVDPYLRAIIQSEIRARRGFTNAPNERLPNTSPSMAIEGDADEAESRFAEYWNSCEGLTLEDHRSWRERLASQADVVQACLEAALTSNHAPDRAKALRMIRWLAQEQRFEERIHGLCHDPDGQVRSLAVGLLVELPSAVAVRILHGALNDPDDRVQATAVETLDRMNVPERASVTATKLRSRSNRVRANAVASLLKLEVREAGETLLDMLEDQAQAHRVSALWVIEHLGLASLLDRVSQLARGDPNDKVRLRAARVLRALGDGAKKESSAKRAKTPV